MHAYDIQLTRGQTEWVIENNQFKGRKDKYTYDPTDKDERGNTCDTGFTQGFSIISIGFEDQLLTKLMKKLKPKSKLQSLIPIQRTCYWEKCKGFIKM